MVMTHSEPKSSSSLKKLRCEWPPFFSDKHKIRGFFFVLPKVRRGSKNDSKLGEERSQGQRFKADA